MPISATEVRADAQLRRHDGEAAHVANDPAVVGTSLGAMYLREPVQEFFV